MKKLNCKKGFACRKSCISKLKECRVSVSDNSKQRLIELNQNIVKVNEAVGPLPADFLAFITDNNPTFKQETTLFDVQVNKKADLQPQDEKTVKIIEVTEVTKSTTKTDFIRDFPSVDNPEDILTKMTQNDSFLLKKMFNVLSTTGSMTNAEGAAIAAWVSVDTYALANKAILGTFQSPSEKQNGQAMAIVLQNALKKAPRYSPKAIEKRYTKDSKFSKDISKVNSVNQKALGKENNPENPLVKEYLDNGRNPDSDYFLKRNISINSTQASEYIGRMLGDANVNNGVHSNDTFNAFTFKLNHNFFESNFEILLMPKTDGNSEGRLVDQYKNNLDEGEVLYAPGNKFTLDKIELEGPEDKTQEQQELYALVDKMKQKVYKSVESEDYKIDTEKLGTLIFNSESKIKLYLSEY
jgi:hypothetical protein